MKKKVDQKKGKGPLVLWIHQNFVTAKQAGNSRAIHIVAALLSQKMRVDIVTVGNSYMEKICESNGKQSDLKQEGDLRITRLSLGIEGWAFHRRMVSYLRFFYKAAYYLLKNPHSNVIYATSPPLPQLLLSIISSLRSGAPMVLELRDLWPAFMIEIGLIRSKVIIMALLWIEALSYRWADVHIPVTPGFAEYLLEMGVKPDCITVAPSGGDPVIVPFNKAKRTKIRRCFDLEGKFVTLYTGSLNEHYNIKRLLAIAKFTAEIEPKICFIITGSGRHKEAVETAAKRYGNVRYLGLIPKDDLIELLQAADVGVVSLKPTPLMETVIPGKLLDYLSAGLPLFSLIDGQTGCIIRKAKAGVVVSAGDNAAKAAQTLISLSRMEASDLTEMGLRGRRWVLKWMHGVRLADEVATVTLACSLKDKRSIMSGLKRLSHCAVGAMKDVITRRSHRAVTRLFGEDRKRVIEDSFQSWYLKQDRQVPPEPVNRPMPRLLSRYDR